MTLTLTNENQRLLISIFVALSKEEKLEVLSKLKEIYQIMPKSMTQGEQS